MKKLCTVPECNYPEGECMGHCWGDETRIDAIGQNGGTGEHYQVVDMVNHPPHYTQGGIECIDAMKAALSPEQYKGYLKGAAFKYLWRLDHKDAAAENAEKAIWYLRKLREVL